MDKVYLAYKLCDGKEHMVGVYSDIDKAVNALRPLVKSHQKYLSEGQAIKSAIWKSNIDRTIIECEFISDGMQMWVYAVESEVL